LPTVVPSQIVDYIDRNLSFCLPPKSQVVQLSPNACGALSALVHLIDQLPSFLFPADPQSYAVVVQATATVRFVIRRAESQDSQTERALGWPTFDLTVVATARKILATCPDEVPPRHSRELTFIKDQSIRDGILLDLEASRSALAKRGMEGSDGLSRLYCRSLAPLGAEAAG